MEFQISTTSRLPIYRQLGDQIREAVARGRMAAGDQLPSVRELSKELVVNPNTIARTYTELERDGILVSRRGLGVFVGEIKAELTQEARERRLTEMLDRLLTEAVHLGVSAQDVERLVEARMKEFEWND